MLLHIPTATFSPERQHLDLQLRMCKQHKEQSESGKCVNSESHGVFEAFPKPAVEAEPISSDVTCHRSTTADGPKPTIARPFAKVLRVQNPLLKAAAWLPYVYPSGTVIDLPCADQVPIQLQELQHLVGTRWLSDAVINSFMTLVVQINKERSIQAPGRYVEGYENMGREAVTGMV